MFSTECIIKKLSTNKTIFLTNCDVNTQLGKKNSKVHQIVFILVFVCRSQHLPSQASSSSSLTVSSLAISDWPAGKAVRIVAEKAPISAITINRKANRFIISAKN